MTKGAMVLMLASHGSGQPGLQSVDQCATIERNCVQLLGGVTPFNIGWAPGTLMSIDETAGHHRTPAHP